MKKKLIEKIANDTLFGVPSYNVWPYCLILGVCFGMVFFLYDELFIIEHGMVTIPYSLSNGVFLGQIAVIFTFFINCGMFLYISTNKDMKKYLRSSYIIFGFSTIGVGYFVVQMVRSLNFPVWEISQTVPILVVAIFQCIAFALYRFTLYSHKKSKINETEDGK